MQLTGTNPCLFEIFNDSVDNVVYVKEYADVQEYNTPVVLADYTINQIPSITNANTGSLIMLSNQGGIGYKTNGVWFLMTGTQLIL
jgi:hypothetical protein